MRFKRSRSATGAARTRRRARKRFGQHFLEAVWVRKLVAAVQAAGDQTFLEIGPGRGALTLPLAEQARRIVAVEIDRDLAGELRRTAPPNVTVVTGDFLDVDVVGLVGERHVRVVANLPYNVSSPVLFKLLALARDRRLFSDATLMLQREVADRLLAAPGTRDYGALTILVALHATVTRLLTLPPGAFRPPPRVTSAVVRLTFRAPPVRLSNPALFEALVRTVFQRRRKTLLNALAPFAASTGVSPAGVLADAAIDSRRRPETLDLTELAALAEVFAALTAKDRRG